MKKIGFLISKLGAGGAERMIVNLANSFSKEFGDYSIVLFHFGSPQKANTYRIESSVRVVCLDDSGSRNGLARRLFRYVHLFKAMRALGPWHAVISFIPQANFMNIAMSIPFRYLAVVCERNIRYHPSNPAGTDSIRSILYPLASMVVFQTPEQARSYPRLSGNKVIPNYVRNGSSFAGGGENIEGYFLCVASFTVKKNHLLLIEMYSDYCRESKAPRDLVLVGEGGEEEKIREEVAKRGLENKVVFAGKTREIERFYVGSAVVLLASEHEGFPNVLIEGIACGRPFISFDVPTGPAYIANACIGKVGVLAEPFNQKDYVQNMLALDNRNKLQEMQINASRSRNVFSEKSIVKQWFDLV